MSVQLYSDTDDLHKANVEIIGADDPHFTLIATLEPGKTYAVPLGIAYHCRLYVAPTNML